MTEIKLYQCEACGKIYTGKSKVIECEKHHATGLKISDCKYPGMNVWWSFSVKKP